MSDIDKQIQLALKGGANDPLGEFNETNFYREAFDSFRGPQRGMYILTWIGIFIFSGLLITCIVKFFGAETTRDQIFFAAGAILLNSAQIALKLWYNMRLNRQVLLTEIHRLQVLMAARA